MIAVAAWIAKQERIRISERVRAGLSRAKQQGTRSGNPVGRPKQFLTGKKSSTFEARDAHDRKSPGSVMRGLQRCEGFTIRLRRARACQNRASRIRKVFREPRYCESTSAVSWDSTQPPNRTSVEPHARTYAGIQPDPPSLHFHGLCTRP
jgi:DNA invertase Pin-like site-specific DNA recombinase